MKDLFDEKEIASSGAFGWGMMMGGIEVVDASNYLVVSEQKIGNGSKGKDKQTLNTSLDDPASPPSSDDDEEDPFGDCDISDEEGDIMILEPGEKRPAKESNRSKVVDKNAGGDWEGELEKGEWDDSDDEDDEKAKFEPNVKKEKINKEKAKKEKINKEKAKKESTSDLPPPTPPHTLTPFEKKAKTLSTVSNLLQYHKTTTALQTKWQITCSGITLPYLVAHNFARLGYPSPMAIQAATLPSAILGRRDIVGAAPTGSGKTLCYGLSLVMGCLKDLESETELGDGMKALVLVPTRELAMQVTKEITEYCKVPDEKVLKELRGDSKKKKKKKKKKEPKLLETEGIVRVCAIVGGLSKEKQERVLKNKPEIVVATPGRLWELVSYRVWSLGFVLGSPMTLYCEEEKTYRVYIS
jgi:ATP-dependent RNA helicase DDX24/MAK5